MADSCESTTRLASCRRHSTEEQVLPSSATDLLVSLSGRAMGRFSSQTDLGQMSLLASIPIPGRSLGHLHPRPVRLRSMVSSSWETNSTLVPIHNPQLFAS